MLEETGYQFEVQSSSDASEFKTVALVFTTTKTGSEQYAYRHRQETGTLYYRLNEYHKQGHYAP